MAQQNTMEILYDADLMSEFGMKKNFINRHAKEMGSRGRPRKFLRLNVQRFVAVYFCDQLMEDLAEKEEALRAEGLLQSLRQPVFESASVPCIGGGKILGKGGRVKLEGRSKNEEGKKGAAV